MSTGPVNYTAIASLVTARIVYAINWLNIGALFFLMSPDLGAGVSGLGTVTSSFYLGVGLMQIPGGVVAAKRGPKSTVIIGVLVSSLAVLGSSISSSVLELATLRFIVGSGMALVFSPMVVLASRLLRNRSGVGAGIVNSAFDVGGLAGLFGWIILANTTGWRPSLLISGGIGLLSAFATMILVPNDKIENQIALSSRKLKGILANRKLVVLGFGALGSNLGSVLISSFMVFYLQSELGVEAAIAGLVAALIVIIPIFTSFWGGRVYDRQKKPRAIMVASGVGMVSALIVCSLPSISSASLGALLGGIAVGPSSTVAFAAARDLSRVESEYESLLIGWVNSISLTGSVWPPLVFSYFAKSAGYSTAWLAGAGLSLLFLIPLLFLREHV